MKDGKIIRIQKMSLTDLYYLRKVHSNILRSVLTSLLNLSVLVHNNNDFYKKIGRKEVLRTKLKDLDQII